MKTSGLILDCTQKFVWLTNTSVRIQNGGVGGAFSMWLNIIDCSGEGGIMVTEENERFRQTGFNMFCARDDNSLW